MHDIRNLYPVIAYQDQKKIINLLNLSQDVYFASGEVSILLVHLQWLAVSSNSELSAVGVIT